MKLILIVLVFGALAQAKNVIDLEGVTAFDYLSKYGLPLAEKIRVAEEASRISGGSPVTAGVIPYQAGLLATFSIGRGVCGGSILNAVSILTAAHCWWDGSNQASGIEVILGSTTLFTGGTRLYSQNVIMHSDWNPTWVRNDIAVIKLPSTITFTALIAPIALPSGTQLNELFIGEVAVISGFGRTGDSQDDEISNNQVLSQARTNVISNFVCSQTFSFLIQDSNICISGSNGISTCRGDSGGPLTVTRAMQPLLVGVSSFGTAGCAAGNPAAFARVTSFINFIRQNM